MLIYKLSNLIAERCSVLFGFSPKITIDDTDEEKSAPKLEYMCSIYEKFNIKTTRTLAEEIDKILLFCDKEYNSLSA